MRIIYLCAVLLLAACSTTTRIPLDPLANSCQLDHVAATVIASYGVLVCWDDNLDMGGVALARGKSIGEAALNAASTAAAIAGVVTAIGSVDTGTEINIPIPGQ